MSDGDEDMLRTQNRQLERENRTLRRNLRDEFAMAALPAVIAKLDDVGSEPAFDVAQMSYIFADALLEARK